MEKDAQCILSFDVEDWFQVENFKGVIHKDSWEHRELRVEKNIEVILDILSERNIKATFFILGWVAEKIPGMIRQIACEEHEIASHGYGHKLIYNTSKEEFEEDLIKSKKILEDLTGQAVVGYRAPSFSITSWAISILKDNGFLYDSSYFPALYHDRYGTINIPSSNSPIIDFGDNFYEVRISYLNFLSKPIPWGGGGYFRLYPYPLFRMGVRRILRQEKYFLFYLHPWEIDETQPVVRDIKWRYYFRHYYGIHRTEKKLKRLLQNFQFSTIRKVLDRRE